MTIQDRAAREPGIPKVGLHLADNGDTVGIAFALAVHGPDGEIITPSTAITFAEATKLRDLITELLDDVPDPTTGLDLDT